MKEGMEKSTKNLDTPPQKINYYYIILLSLIRRWLCAAFFFRHHHHEALPLVTASSILLALSYVAHYSHETDTKDLILLLFN